MNCYGCLKPIVSGPYCKKCLKNVFDNRKIKPLGFDKNGFYEQREKAKNRMSISGVQPKVSLVFNEEDALLIPVDKDGEYILKPAPKDEGLKNLSDLVPNEHLSMQISKQVYGIKTADCALIEFNDKELAYITKRFDYTSGFESKLDQEDFASALEYSEQIQGENYKYDGSYQECGELVRDHTAASVIMVEEFFKRVVLNYLIGNGDAHLKNFSFYFPEGSQSRILTPSYDVVYTRLHVSDSDMAMDLFKDDYEPIKTQALGYQTFIDFDEFADALEINSRRKEKIFKNFFDSKEAVLNLIGRSYMSEEGKASYSDFFLERLERRLKYGSKEI